MARAGPTHDAQKWLLLALVGTVAGGAVAMVMLPQLFEVHLRLLQAPVAAPARDTGSPPGFNLRQKTTGSNTDCKVDETQQPKTTSSTSPLVTTPRQASSTMTSPPSTTTTPSAPTTPMKPFVPCDWQVEKIPLPTRLQAVLVCNKTSADIIVREVRSDTTPVTTLSSAHDASCLQRVIQTRCSDVSLRVPRVAHYVWFGPRNMSLHFFVGVLSVVRFLRPCLLLFHGERVPAGPYWLALLQLVPHVVHVPRPRPRRIFGNVINVVEHSADVTRLQLLIEYGGVYVDSDQYLLRPVDDLLNNSVVIGIETAGSRLGNGLIFSEPEAPFLQMWLANYTSFNDRVWGEHSTQLPYNLSRVVPHLVTVVDSFFRPNYKEIEPLYKNRDYDWGQLYGLHLYYRFYRQYFETDTRLDRQSCVVGDMTRHILFGSRISCFSEDK